MFTFWVVTTHFDSYHRYYAATGPDWVGFPSHPKVLRFRTYGHAHAFRRMIGEGKVEQVRDVVAFNVGK